jgi:hypothetical protein
VITLISHSMTFSILSAHTFADVAGNLMLMTLSWPLPLRLPKHAHLVLLLSSFFLKLLVGDKKINSISSNISFSIGAIYHSKQILLITPIYMSLSRCLCLQESVTNILSNRTRRVKVIV